MPVLGEPETVFQVQCALVGQHLDCAAQLSVVCKLGQFTSYTVVPQAALFPTMQSSMLWRLPPMLYTNMNSNHVLTCLASAQ